MADKESKTEEATPKRLKDARKKGQVARSSELAPAVSLIVFAMTASFIAMSLFKNSLLYVQSSLRADFGREITTSNLSTYFPNLIDLFILILPYLAIGLLVGVAVNIFQTGLLFTTTPLKPDFKRINPISGFKNIFSKKAAFSLAKNIVKLILVAFLAYNYLANSFNKILNAGNLGTEKLFPFIMQFVVDLVINIGIIMLGLAIVDFVFQKRDHKKNLKMTMQEIKDEYKETEGNPQIKQARSQKQRQLALSRMMSSIEKSNVVITNPTHIAVAIKYDDKEDNAPIVVAKGVDFLAQKIKEKAKENKIPIVENKELARAIYKDTEVGDYIPVELYKLVAEVLAYVYNLEKKKKKKI
ncbi:MAG: flagellar biosynthesis protein FlhB [Tissierellales bacterium]|nr:flagellar biosynthesis protein FlhB [Tissierellales bacterium]